MFLQLSEGCGHAKAGHGYVAHLEPNLYQVIQPVVSPNSFLYGAKETWISSGRNANVLALLDLLDLL